MAVITAFQRLSQEGSAQKAAFYRVQNVTTGDTLPLVADFARILVVTAVDVTRSTTQNAQSFAGTTITFNQAGLLNDDLYVMVIGAGA